MEEPPTALRAFDPGSRTGVEMWEAFSSWRAQRVSYGCEHGWPGGMPALLQENVALRRALHDPEQV